MILGYRKRSGISLLEVMLSITVIAIIVLTATRYYSSTSSSRKVNDATQIIKNVNAALDEWQNMMKNNQTPPVLSTVALVNVGLLPANFAATGANPWGGSIQTTISRSGQYTITLTSVPQGDCLTLVQVMQRDGITGSCSNNNFVGTR